MWHTKTKSRLAKNLIWINITVRYGARSPSPDNPTHSPYGNYPRRRRKGKNLGKEKP